MDIKVPGEKPRSLFRPRTQQWRCRFGNTDQRLEPIAIRIQE